MPLLQVLSKSFFRFEQKNLNAGDLIHQLLRKRHIRDFEEAGLIERQVALLNPKMAGFNLQVLLLVAMQEHTEKNRESFERHVSLLPEVMECFSVSGDRDYLLQVVAHDMDSYNDFLNRQILRHEAVQSASSTFVLRRVKYSTALPL